MNKLYKHKDFEGKIYKLWEKSGGFTPRFARGKGLKTFTIIMPPPNANDPLHVGHAMFVTVEDILIRFHRMGGEATLWLPGTDHAGIETQFVFEKKLKDKGKSRFDYDRETLYQMIWDYVQENSGIAVEQLKKIGASADWSKFKFTLDKEVVTLVINTFEKLHQDKLIYRGVSLINYCTECGTGFSELEVKRVERKAPLYYMKYGPFTIATARPETKFRDTALAANPSDKRYEEWFGRTLQIPGLLGPIKMTVIEDEEVDPAFGTGIMKVTPAHDPHDFELGKKYGLPVVPIIDFEGRMDFSWFLKQKNMEAKYRTRAEAYHGKKVIEARKLMIEDLKEDGLLEKIDENHKHSIGTCYRCGSILEPLPLPQFFVKVKALSQKALKELKARRVKIIGAGHDKILKHWLKNLNDWNISRQIVWGIRMPVWYRVRKMENGKWKMENSTIYVKFLDKDKKLVEGKVGQLLKKYTFGEIKQGLQELRAPVGAEYVVSPTPPSTSLKLRGSGGLRGASPTPPGDDYLQETDTFDTWFSSAQWPFVTLMSHSSSKLKVKNSKLSDFDRFYPTQVMETAYDILIFWVMRMLMMGLYATGKIPFEKVYLHGLIRDEKGQKMSKSKGNVINPLDVIEKYGADALRMALVIRSTPGLDKGVGDGDFRAMRNLTNKIWNATRYVISRISNDKFLISNQAPSPNDQTFKRKLNRIVQNVTKQLDDLRVGLAAETVYNEFWHWFCDECIEQAKREELSAKSLLQGLVTFLKLLHPFVPFVTEAVYGELKTAGLVDKKESLLMNSRWPDEINV